MKRRENYPFAASPAGLEQQIQLLVKKCKVEAYAGWHFHKTRKWEFDFCLPKLKIAVEYQGLFGIRNREDGLQGGHQSIAGLLRDWEKWREAQILGWIVLPFGPGDTRTGEAMNVIERAILSRLESAAKGEAK